MLKRVQELNRYRVDKKKRGMKVKTKTERSKVRNVGS